MSKEFKCPVCGAINEQMYDDSINEESYNDKIVIKYSGYCGECGADLLWEETYILSDYNNIKIAKI